MDAQDDRSRGYVPQPVTERLDGAVAVPLDQTVVALMLSIDAHLEAIHARLDEIKTPSFMKNGGPSKPGWLKF